VFSHYIKKTLLASENNSVHLYYLYFLTGEIDRVKMVKPLSLHYPCENMHTCFSRYSIPSFTDECLQLSDIMRWFLEIYSGLKGIRTLSSTSLFVDINARPPSPSGGRAFTFSAL